MTVATPQEPTSTIVAILTDPSERWDVYPGAAPVGSSGLFVCVWPMSPSMLASGVASESWGQVREQWTVSFFADSVDEARKLRDEVLRLDGWGRDWELELISPIRKRDIAEERWQGSMIVRDIRVV